MGKFPTIFSLYLFQLQQLIRHRGVWILHQNSCVSFIESESGCNGRRLRQNRYFGANWEGLSGMQCNRHRVTSLVRYVSIPEKTYCSMAHFERSRRRNSWRKEVKRISETINNNFKHLQQFAFRILL